MRLLYAGGARLRDEHLVQEFRGSSSHVSYREVSARSIDEQDHQISIGDLRMDI